MNLQLMYAYYIVPMTPMSYIEYICLWAHVDCRKPVQQADSRTCRWAPVEKRSSQSPPKTRVVTTATRFSHGTCCRTRPQRTHLRTRTAVCSKARSKRRSQCPTSWRVWVWTYRAISFGSTFMRTWVIRGPANAFAFKMLIDENLYYNSAASASQRQAVGDMPFRSLQSAVGTTWRSFATEAHFQLTWMTFCSNVVELFDHLKQHRLWFYLFSN